MRPEKKQLELSEDEKFAMRSKMLDEKIEQKAQMKKILKPEQFKKWEQHQENRKGKITEKSQNRKEKKRKILK